MCFQIAGKAGANWALGTQHSWEGWKLPKKVRETLLSSALKALGAEKKGAYKESGIGFIP